jgi:hypothetical protein
MAKFAFFVRGNDGALYGPDFVGYVLEVVEVDICRAKAQS